MCASCSPHRITIPRQFIVHPPSESTANLINLTGDDENTMSPFGPFRNPALGGGEEVRVCNPCVPDPNFSPPPRYDSLGNGPRPFPPRSSQVPPAPPPHPRAHRSSSSVHDGSRFAHQPQTHGPRDTSNEGSQSRRVSYHGNSNIGERRLPPLHPSATQQQQQQHPHHRAPLISQTIANNRARQAQNAIHFGYGGSFSASSPFNRTTSTPVPLPLQPQYAQPPRPRRQIPEEDECPICGQELPAKGPDGDDAERTQHIEECIALHSASPRPTAALNLTQQTSASLPTQRTRGMSSAGANLNNGEGASNLQSRMSHAARGMFPYIATEKDCVDEEGRVAVLAEPVTIGEEKAAAHCRVSRIVAVD